MVNFAMCTLLPENILVGPKQVSKWEKKVIKTQLQIITMLADEAYFISIQSFQKAGSISSILRGANGVVQSLGNLSNSNSDNGNSGVHKIQVAETSIQ